MTGRGCARRTKLKISAPFLFGITLLLFSLQGLRADMPKKSEELVYTILAFNGKDYSHTFCREEAGTIYILANCDNFITIRKTFVYFWPITGQWNTDFETLNEVVDGYIEIKEKKSSRVLAIKKVKYTFFNIRGEYENQWKVLTDGEAYRERDKWKKMYYGYIEEVEKYHEEYEAYRKRFNELLQVANNLKKRGENFTDILQQIDSLKQPEEPVQPLYYNVPPVPVEEAYILNLPVGEFEVRFILPDGKVLEGSEKRVVSFEKRRGRGVGFDIIPGDKWTRPVQNTVLSSIIYINGKTDIFIRPFFENEYNDLYYNRLVRNDSTGNIHAYSWMRIRQVPGSIVEVTYKDGRKELIREGQFIVEQAQGPSLGYTIVTYDPKGEHAGIPPNLIAFHIPREPGERSVTLKLLDTQQRPIENGEREIRVINGERYRLISVVFIFIPILSMFIVLGIRRRKYSQ